MKSILLFLVITYSSIISAQNVGVGTTNPTERLDVNGNINITGTIKANGVDGFANQVLMKNGNGILTWSDLSEFKNKATFTATGATNWTVPANTRRILVEAWGAGGGGSSYTGGGGGGYVAAAFTVATGDIISINNGTGGAAASAQFTAGTGGTTQVVVGTITINAGGGIGGAGANLIATSAGGTGTVSNGYLNYITMPGENGHQVQNHFITGESNMWEVCSNGDGGNAANSNYTAGSGMYRMVTTASPQASVRTRSAESGKQPGGGGGSGFVLLTINLVNSGAAGGNGMTIIHY